MSKPILNEYYIKYLLVFLHKSGDESYRSEYQQSFVYLRDDSGENLEGDAEYLFDTIEEAQKMLHGTTVQNIVREHNEECDNEDIDENILITDGFVKEIKISILIQDPVLTEQEQNLKLTRTF